MGSREHFVLYNENMEEKNIPHPPIVDRAAFDDARGALLADEKWLTKQPQSA